MPEDKERIINNPLEVTPTAPRVQYRFSRFTLHERTNHYADVLYGSEPLHGAQLAKAYYTNGELTSVAIKYGTKEDLLEKSNRSKTRRRGFSFGGPGHLPAYPSHDAVRIVVNGDEFEVYDDEFSHLGKQVGTTKVGERFIHEAIPYIIEISRTEGQTTFKRIAPSNNSEWELSVPNQAPINGPEKIPVSFKG